MVSKFGHLCMGSRKALLNQHIFKVLFDKIEINKWYFVFSVKYKLQEMELKTHGATMKHIVKKDFDNILIPFLHLKNKIILQVYY